MKAAHPERPARPLVVLGWDGATPELVLPWIADGTLPHLAALAARGTVAPLRSLIHPLSPGCWTSAFTGLQPGRHGIFDFGRRVPGTMTVEPTDARQRHGAALWEVAQDCGLRTLVVNVPMTHPAPDQAGSILIPGVGAPGLEDSCRPRSLFTLLRQEAAEYCIDVHSFEHTDPHEFLRATARSEEARAKVVGSLLQRERPDLVVAVFTSTDRVQHAFWKQSARPGTDPHREAWGLAHAVRDSYRRLDDALGRIVEAAGPDAAILVVSDHGFGDLDGDLFLNTLLEEDGLLQVRREPALRGLRAMWSRRPPASQEGSPTFGDIDWSRTQAYARGLMGGIWLNLRGREPHGTVESGPPAQRLLTRIEALLHAARIPGTSERLVDAVLRGPDLYSGERLEEAPDLVVVPRGYRFMTRSGRELGPRGVLVAPSAVRHTGNHRMDGIFVGAGPGIRPGGVGVRLQLLDLTPTCLALLGIEVPTGLDGVVMEDVLSCEVATTSELPWRTPPDLARSDEERRRIEAQMRGLGYLA